MFMSNSPMGRAIITVGARPCLIAAAPELLEALRLMIGYPGHGKTVDERIEIARAVIAKAEGL